MSMNNFQIDIIDGTYNIFFENKFIGHIQYSTEDQGFIVQPHGASYNGFFKELETAITELVFHTYASNRKVPSC